jgi:hypothetical protein
MKRLVLITLIIPFLTLAEQSAQAPSPLTDAQIEIIKKVLFHTRDAEAAVKLQLTEKQLALKEAYASYRLDEKQISALQGDIGKLQQQLLSNYHHLQVELRKTVGKDRFTRLKLRIDYYLKSSAAEKNSGASGVSRPADPHTKGK